MPISHLRSGLLMARLTAAKLKCHLVSIQGAQFPQQLSELGDILGKLLTLGGADPADLQAILAKTRDFQQIAHHIHPLGRIDITFQVMAVSRVSAKDKDPVIIFL